jgi:hypothetical protein
VKNWFEIHAYVAEWLALTSLLPAAISALFKKDQNVVDAASTAVTISKEIHLSPA